MILIHSYKVVFKGWAAGCGREAPGPGAEQGLCIPQKEEIYNGIL